MAALGNDPRLAAMLVAAQGEDEIATAAKLAAILEEPPRGGSVDLGVMRSQAGTAELAAARAASCAATAECRSGAR